MAPTHGYISQIRSCKDASHKLSKDIPTRDASIDGEDPYHISGISNCVCSRSVKNRKLCNAISPKA